MKTAKKGIELIKKFEGVHDGDLKAIGLQPKKCPAGIWTLGYGRAMRDFKGSFLRGDKMPQYTISESEAQQYLYEDLHTFEVIVSRKITVGLNQNQFDALVSHAYNTGGSDGLYRLINRKAPIEDIKKWWIGKYITANGKVLQGLVNRRKEEFNLYIQK